MCIRDRKSTLLCLIIVFTVCACAGASVPDDLARPRDYTTHRISSYDTYGGNGDGGQGNPLKVCLLYTSRCV